MQAAGGFDYFDSRSQPKMICVAEDDLSVEVC
jgi:hypothetical protein